MDLQTLSLHHGANGLFADKYFDKFTKTEMITRTLLKTLRT